MQFFDVDFPPTGKCSRNSKRFCADSTSPQWKRVIATKPDKSNNKMNIIKKHNCYYQWCGFGSKHRRVVYFNYQMHFDQRVVSIDLGFLYAIFVQSSIFPTKLNFYPIPLPPPPSYFSSTQNILLLSISIVRFLTNYDVINRKQ